MDGKIAVSVICTTYNHEKYIRQCLESLVVQKTNFDYEIVVQDDCSSDKTPLIIKEFEEKYPEKIKPVYQKENQLSKGLRPAYVAAGYANGEFLCHCEGDDYWCDENKLQLQYDYMTAHPDCALCFHNTFTYYEDSGELEENWIFWKDKKYKGPGIYTSEELVDLGVVPVASMMYKRKDIDHIDLTSKIIKYGDIAKTLWLADKGYGYCFEKNMSVYRKNVNESVMTKVYKGVENYNKGILSTIETYENFDKYSEHRFHSILDKKIKELENQYLSIDISELKKQVSNNSRIYIYGTGVYGRLCAVELTNNGMDFCGFVVSDGQSKPEIIMEHHVRYLSEVKEENVTFIPAAGQRVMPVIINNIKNKGFENICMICREGKESV